MPDGYGAVSAFWIASAALSFSLAALLVNFIVSAVVTRKIYSSRGRKVAKK